MSNLTKTNQNVKTAKMDQSLVHIKHTITWRQYKYWHLMIMLYAQKYERGEYPNHHGFYFESRETIAKYMGYEPNTKELKADIEALTQQPIVINYLEKNGKQATRGMNFISEYEITSNKIGFVLPSLIRDVIAGDDESKKMHLFINWDILHGLGGKYEGIIYKLCKDYIGVGRTPYFTIEEYREYIGLNNDEYSQFFKLNEWTIKKPLEKLNKDKDCDIEVKVEFEKKGRSVVGLYFTMKYKKQACLPFVEFEPITAFSAARLAIPKETQIQYLDTYTEEQIEAIIERSNEYIDTLKASGKPVQMGAIYNKAFRENWGAEKLEQKKLTEVEDAEQKIREKTKKKLAEESAKIESDKMIVENQLLNDFESYNQETKKVIIENMLDRQKLLKPLHKKLQMEYQNFYSNGFKIGLLSNAFKANLLHDIKEHQATLAKLTNSTTRAQRDQCGAKPKTTKSN